MLSHYLKCRKTIESKNAKVVKSKNERLTLLSNCPVYKDKKLRFVKGQKATG